MKVFAMNRSCLCNQSKWGMISSCSSSNYKWKCRGSASLMGDFVIAYVTIKLCVFMHNFVVLCWCFQFFLHWIPSLWLMFFQKRCLIIQMGKTLNRTEPIQLCFWQKFYLFSMGSIGTQNGTMHTSSKLLNYFRYYFWVAHQVAIFFFLSPFSLTTWPIWFYGRLNRYKMLLW